MLINGQWVNATSGEFFDDYNPYTGEVFARVPKGDEKDAGLAMAAAFDARKPWSSTPPVQRAQILFKAARLLEESTQEYASALAAEGVAHLEK
jgi:acyl-CoA reductase-like NAD-dependent aldehyde dehydrogenase